MNKQFRLQYKYVNVINKIKTIVFTPIYIYIYMYLNVTCHFSLKDKSYSLNAIIKTSSSQNRVQPHQLDVPVLPNPNHPYLILINFLLSHTITFFFFFLILLLLFLFLFFLSFFVHAHTDHQFHNENNFKSQSENFWNLLNSIGII